MAAKTIDPERQKDTQIYFAMLENAQKVFAKVIVNPGEYTAEELVKMTDCRSKDYKNIFEGVDASEIMAVSVGSFSCKYPASLAFMYLKQWQSIAKIKTADRAKFVREDQTAKTPLYSFEVTAAMVEAVKACGDDELRRIMNGMYFDTENNFAVATDGHVLNAVPFAPVAAQDAEELQSVVITAKDIKRSKGKTITIYQTEEGITAEAEGAKLQTIEGRFPNWKSVIGCVDQNAYVEFGKLSTFAKVAQSVARDGQTEVLKHRVIIATCEGSEAVTISAENKDEHTAAQKTITANVAKYNGKISISAKNLSRMPQGITRMYFNDYTRAVIFMGGGCLSLMMPVLPDVDEMPKQETTYNTDANAFGVLAELTAAEESAKVAKKTTRKKTVETIEETTAKEETTEAVAMPETVTEVAKIEDAEPVAEPTEGAKVISIYEMPVVLCLPSPEMVAEVEEEKNAVIIPLIPIADDYTTETEEEPQRGAKVAKIKKFVFFLYSVAVCMIIGLFLMFMQDPHAETLTAQTMQTYSVAGVSIADTIEANEGVCMAEVAEHTEAMPEEAERPHKKHITHNADTLTTETMPDDTAAVCYEPMTAEIESMEGDAELLQEGAAMDGADELTGADVEDVDEVEGTPPDDGETIAEGVIEEIESNAVLCAVDGENELLTY